VNATDETLEVDFLEEDFSELELTVIHMAGHAVMGHLQAPGSVKFIALAPVKGGFEGHWELDEEILIDCNPGRALILAAGIAAEILLQGFPIRTKEAVDLFDEFFYRDDKCGDLCEEPGDIDEPMWYRFAWDMVVQAFYILEEHTEAVEELGNRLLVEGFIGKDEIAALMATK